MTPTRYKKVCFALSLSILILVVSLGYVLYTYAVSPTSTFVISGGIYPGAPTYTIWTESGNYYAKNVYGSIAYSGTNASAIINAAIDATTTAGGTVFVKNGLYSISGRTQLTGIPNIYASIVMHDNVSLIGENMYSTILKLEAATAACVIGSNFPAFHTAIKNLCVDGNKALQTSQNVDGQQTGITMDTFYGEISHIYAINCIHEGVYNSGGYFNRDEYIYTVNCGSGDSQSYGGYVFSTPSYSVCDQIWVESAYPGISGGGVKLDNLYHSTATNIHVQNTTGSGIYISSNNVESFFDNLYSINSSEYGILLEPANNTNCGHLFVDRSAHEGIYIIANNSRFDYLSVADAHDSGIIVDNSRNIQIGYVFVKDVDTPSTMSYGVSLYSGGNITVLGGSLDQCHALSGPMIIYPNIGGIVYNVVGFRTENSGNATVSTGGTVTHGLGGIPTMVMVTAGTTGPTDVYVSAVGATTFAINFGGGGSALFYWKAEYRP